jgi:DNA-binding CsgD family transcriptional regulator
LDVLRLLDAMSCAGFLLDGSGRVLKANRGGARLLEREFGLRQGRLMAPDRCADRALQDTIRTAPGSATIARSAAAVLRREEGLPLMVRALPIINVIGVENAAKALVIVVDPEDCPQISRNAYRELFGLTDAEIHIAAGLMCGFSPEEIANHQKKGIGTVRQQLKSIYAKTQTKRQSELVALLARLSMAFAFERAAA